mgnify:CR=1 FL=1
MDRQTKSLPILPDFVPFRGRCPATLCNITTSKKLGKGTADLTMPFGVLFIYIILRKLDQFLDGTSPHPQLEGSEGQLVGSEGLPEESEGLTEGSEGLPFEQ